MYGGQTVPAPAPAFSGFGYSNTELYTSLNNYLQAAYSIKLASNAIKDTSTSQNTLVTGTRNLQKNSALSFQTATTTIQTSLDRLYNAFAGTNPPLTAPPPGYPPHVPPPYTYGPHPWSPPL